MAPKDGKLSQGVPEAIPPSVIEQAEQAIRANFEDDESPISRKSTRSAKPDYSQYQSTSHTAGSSTKANHLQVPNILSSDGSTEAPPAYGENHDEIAVDQDGFNTKAKLTDDGRINININQKTRKLSDLLVPALRQQLSLVAQEEQNPLPPGYIPPALGGLPGQTPPPKLNVVIHVVGSRGDVQPFVALGKVLKTTYGHRVRLATHPTFKTFVEENGLEFFSIGGDPSELMAFMVKNPGLMPGIESLRSGDVGKRRKGMEEIVLGCWRSCIEAGDGLGAPPRRESMDSLGGFDAGINMDANPADRPFIADAIVANPPSFAHIHIAEKLGIPLHMMFTMPWSPTQQFPHPLANIQSSNADVNMTNFVSYALVEMMTWQGLGDVINRFRERALGLDPISLIWAPGMLSRLRIPYTYCWSPALIPKPKDWGQHISISGFFFLSLASSFTPAPELAAYLAAGPPPVYIGFGSIVVDNPDAMTKMIFEAVKKAGVRALVSKGWGGLGADAMGIPEGVFMLGNVPHDWLFQHVSCVVHHGGAGTTAAGIATGKPTVVVPFFGDQPFWGAMVSRAGAGPLPIPYKQLTADKLADALTEALKPETLERAKELGAKIKEEEGCEVGGKAFHDWLKVDELRCSLAPSRAAVWRVKRTQTRLSALAANVLASEGLLEFSDIKLYRPREYETDDGPWDPISGGASALLGTFASLSMGVADFPIEIFRAVKTAAMKKDDASKDTSGSGEDSEFTSPLASPPASASASRSDLRLENATESTDTSFRHDSTSSVSSTPKTSLDSTIRDSARSPTATPLTSTTSFGKGSGSLREALRGTLTRSRSGSRNRGSNSRSDSKDRKSGSRSGSPFRRETKEFDPSQLTLENASRASKGIQRIVAAGMKSPMDFTLSIARGFHNAPKLYGDDTVRPHEKVTDFQSGLKAAGKEFGYGLYDGITGLVTQPMRGAEKEGAAGLVKGIGKGIGGLILKPGAAFWGIPGYTFMGIHKEVRKMFGSSVLNYIIAARTAQGYEDAKAATPQERAEIIRNWREHKAEYQNVKMKLQESGGPEGQESGRLTPKGFLQTRHMTFDERKKLAHERKEITKAKHEEDHKIGISHSHCIFCRRKEPHSHTPRATQHTPTVPGSHAETNDEFEEAIHASVAATSRGDAEEDMMIERAIRASVRELQSAGGSTLTDEEALSKAIKASISEAARRHDSEKSEPATETKHPVISMTDEDAEHSAALEKAIQASLAEYQLSAPPTRDDEELDIPSDEDENLKLALEQSKTGSLPVDKVDDELEKVLRESKEQHEQNQGKGSESEEMEKALQESKKQHEQDKEKGHDLEGGKTEEEIVLEYVKKQSLLEEEHRQASLKEKKRQELKGTDGSKGVGGITSRGAPVVDADEEALRKAIEESMKGVHGAEGDA